MAVLTNVTEDNSFGPQLKGTFDFTLLFEQSIFTILPASILLSASPFIVTRLFRKPARVRSGVLLWAKLILGVTLVAVEAAYLGLWSQDSVQYRTAASIAAAALSLSVAVCVLMILWAQHRHSLRLSSALSTYLSLTILLDAAQIRSTFMRAGLQVNAGILVAATVLKGCLLVLEEVSKRNLFIHKADKVAMSREAASGFWNRRFFLWINSTLWGGFRSILSVDNLQHIGADFDSEILLHKQEKHWEQTEVEKKSAHSLLKASAAAHAVPVLVAIPPRLLFVGFTFAQPFLLHTIVNAVGVSDLSNNTAGGLIGATVLIYLGIALSRACYTHLTFRFITMLRGSLVSLIMKKSLRLQSGTDAASAAVTHMSTDVDSIAQGLESLHDTWVCIVELGVGVYMLTRYVGGATVLIIIPTIVSTIGSGYLGGKLAPAKIAWNQKVEERVSKTSHALSQLKGIKMMGLGPWFFEHIQHSRVVEMNYSKKYRTLLIAMYTTGQLTLSMAPTLVIAGALFWTSLGQGLTAAQVFSTLSIITLVSQPFALLTIAFPILWSIAGCFTRIQNFLLLPERIEQRSVTITPRPSRDIDRVAQTDLGNQTHEVQETNNIEKASELQINGASFAFEVSAEPVLKDVNISIPASSFAVIMGGVGSGKTTLLRGILGEVEMKHGEICMGHSSLAYCGQTSWLRNISIRDNIICEDDFDLIWYNIVMDACLLSEDIQDFPQRDKSLAGNGGSTLSGGQKQRVALARAVYSKKRLVLLDDVFSALDRRTSNTVFSRLLRPGGVLRRSGITVILATHNSEYAAFADVVFALEAGGIVSAKDPNEIHSELKNAAESSNAAEEEQINRQRVPDESLSNQNGDSPSQSCEITTKNSDEHDPNRQGGDFTLYNFYFKSVGRITIVVWFTLAVTYVLAYQMPNVWVRIWLETAPENNLYFIGYAGWSILGLVLGFCALGFFMLKFVPESAENLHRTLLEVVMKQPLWHFTAVDSGNTLNRFSQDMTLVTQELPMAFFMVTFFSLINITTIAIIVSGAKYTAAIIPLFVVALCLLQSFYLRTSRQMRHLDLEAKSPLYTLLTEIESGLQHIRAFNWQAAFLENGLQRLNVSQKPYYLMFCIQRWLTLVLDIFVAIIAIVLITFVVKITSSSSATAIGLALTNLVGYGESLAQLIQYWANLETSLGAIARLRTYVSETPTEKDSEQPTHPPESWPGAGKIEIRGLTAKYNVLDTSTNNALENINLTIQPGQKVGVIGRTGSGKSSFMLSILRLVDISGSILIDDVDIKTITLQHLRSHITTITQDPVTLPGSIRINLFPYTTEGSIGAVDDESMSAALLRVGLLEQINQRGGLDADLSSVQLSAGEMQLLCLARAILHNASTKSRVILIDEATSSMDSETEERAQNVFKDFSSSGCTVIMIAHRMATVEDSDVILELGNGKILNVIEKGTL